MNTKQIIFVLALLIGVCSFGGKVFAAESADDLLHKSEDALVKAQSFSVEYSTVLQSGGEAVWLAFQGKLFFKGEDHYFLTNIGNMFLVFPANKILVSDGKNFLEINLWRNHESGPIQSVVADWDPGRPGPLSKQECVKRIVRDGFTFLVAALVYDNMNKTRPMFKSLPGLLTYPASLEQPSSVTNAQILADDSVSGKVIRHINYGIERGTNGLEKVDLWLDAKSFLPIKRVTVPPHMSEGIAENYSFVLNVKVNPSLFDPKRLIREQKLEQQIAKAEKPDSRLLKAATGGDEALAIEALKAGANPNARASQLPHDQPTPTALMLAAMSGNVKIVERLVEAGADLNATVLSGATPLQFAVMNGNAEVVKFLIKHGADLKTNGAQALLWAAWQGHEDLVDILIEKKVDVDQPSSIIQGGTPLYAAALGGHLQIVKDLVANGAKIEAGDDIGRTPLSIAFYGGNTSVIKYLVEKGANVNSQDAHGMTPLMQAAAFDNAEAVDLLLAKGADPTLKNKSGKNAMDIANRHLPNDKAIEVFRKFGLTDTKTNKTSSTSK